MALVLLICRVVMTFVFEMATAQLRTAENTAVLFAYMQSLMKKIETQPMASIETLPELQ
jgi:hypothetical protein